MRARSIFALLLLVSALARAATFSAFTDPDFDLDNVYPTPMFLASDGSFYLFTQHSPMLTQVVVKARVCSVSAGCTMPAAVSSTTDQLRNFVVARDGTGDTSVGMSSHALDATGKYIQCSASPVSCSITNRGAYDSLVGFTGVTTRGNTAFISLGVSGVTVLANPVANTQTLSDVFVALAYSSDWTPTANAATPSVYGVGCMQASGSIDGYIRIIQCEGAAAIDCITVIDNLIVTLGLPAPTVPDIYCGSTLYSSPAGITATFDATTNTLFVLMKSAASPNGVIARCVMSATPVCTAAGVTGLATYVFNNAAAVYQACTDTLFIAGAAFQAPPSPPSPSSPPMSTFTVCTGVTTASPSCTSQNGTNANVTVLAQHRIAMSATHVFASSIFGYWLEPVACPSPPPSPPPPVPPQSPPPPPVDSGPDSIIQTKKSKDNTALYIGLGAGVGGGVLLIVIIVVVAVVLVGRRKTGAPKSNVKLDSTNKSGKASKASDSA